MTVAISSITNNQTLGVLVDTVSSIAQTISTNTITTSIGLGATVTTGNAFVNGFFGANIMIISNNVTGGSFANPNTLYVTSNLSVVNATAFFGNSTSNVQVGYLSDHSSIQENYGNQNNFVQIAILNANTGTSGSVDLALYTDPTYGISSNSFIDIGLNSVNWSNTQWTINGPGDGYLYMGSNNLSIGSNGASYINFFTGGTLSTNEVMRITSGANVGIGTSTPDAKFKVQGTANVTGNVVLGQTVSIWGNLSANGVVSDFIPASDNTYSLGNSANKWKSLYVGGSTIYINTAAISVTAGNTISLPALAVTNATVIGGNTSLAYINATANAFVLTTNTSSTNLAIKATAAFTNAVTMANTLDVTGATSFANSTSHTGNATFSNTLAVTGNVTISNAVAITGNATLSNTIAVTGAATLSNTVAITGATTIGNTLIIAGVTTVNNNFIANGSITGNGALAQGNGAATFTNTVAITGAATLSNTITVTGNVSLLYINATANAIVLTTNTTSTNLAIFGTTTFTNVVNHSNNITVSGLSTLNTAAISGAITANSTLAVNGAVTTNSSVTVNGAFTVSNSIIALTTSATVTAPYITIGNTTVNTTVNASAITTVNVNATTIGGTLTTVSQPNITANNALFLNGNTAATLRARDDTAYANATAYTDTQIAGLSAAEHTYADGIGATAYANAVTFANTVANNAYANAVTFASNATNISSGTLASARLTGAYTGVTQTGTLSGLAVTGNGSFTNNVSANNLALTTNLTVGGNATITGNLNITGTTILNTIQTGNIIPATNSYYLGNTTSRWNLLAITIDSAGGNSTFANVVINGNTTAANASISNLIVVNQANLQGTTTVNGAFTVANTILTTGAANLNSLGVVNGANVGGDLRVLGSLYITGSTISSSSSTGDLIPTSNTVVLGDTTHRFNLYGMLGNFVNTVTVGEQLVVNSTAQYYATKTTITPPTGLFTLTPTSNNITIGSVPAGVTAGQYITGTGIPSGATVVSYNSTTVVMSVQATGSGAQTIVFNNPQNIVDNTLSASVYRSAEFTIQITLTDSSTPGTYGFQTSKYMAFHDGVNTFGTEYAVLNNGNTLATFSTDINSSVMRLKMAQVANLTSTQSLSVAISRTATII
jgi:hypothetical protein